MASADVSLGTLATSIGNTQVRVEIGCCQLRRGLGLPQPACCVSWMLLRAAAHSLRLVNARNLRGLCSENGPPLCILPSRSLVEVADRARVFWITPGHSSVCFAATPTGHLTAFPLPTAFPGWGKGGEGVGEGEVTGRSEDAPTVMLSAEATQCFQIGGSRPKERDIRHLLLVEALRLQTRLV